MHRDDIWYILAVGTELFWSLEKKWGDILKADLTNSTRAKIEKISDCDRCQLTCVIGVPSITSVYWFVYACDPQKPSSTSQGVQWELKGEKDGCQVSSSSTECTSLLTLKKKKKFHTRQVYGLTARVCGRTQYINSAFAVRENSNRRCRTWH